MYCKYCGNEIERGASRCPHCGRALRTERGRSGAAFYGMLALPLLPSLLSFLPLLAMGFPDWGGLLRTLVVAALGIGGVMLLCRSGRIQPGRFSAGDVLVWALWLYLPRAADIVITRTFYAALGQDVMIAYTLLEHADAALGQLWGLWTWAELAAAGLVRSGTWKVTAKKALAALGVLVLWSCAALAIRMPYLRMLAGGMEPVLAYLVVGSGLYFLTIWVRRGFELAFAAAYGGRALTPAAGILLTVIHTGLLVLLTPLTAFWLNIGLHALAFSTAGAGLLSLLILVPLTRANRNGGEREKEGGL